MQVLAPVALKLCNDVVCKVRRAAARSIWAVFDGISGKDGSENQICLVENLKLFASSSMCN
jgi:hypothetical protein